MGYTVAQAAEVLGVSDDTVRRLLERGELDAAGDGRRVQVDPASLARCAERRHAEHRPAPGNPESARNRFLGVVTKVQRDGVMAQVDVQAGPFRVVSLLSREAADDLRLEPGALVVASVKSTNVVVERPT